MYEMKKILYGIEYYFAISEKIGEQPRQTLPLCHSGTLLAGIHFLFFIPASAFGVYPDLSGIPIYRDS